MLLGAGLADAAGGPALLALLPAVAKTLKLNRKKLLLWIFT
jgi:hypothetical protein